MNAEPPPVEVVTGLEQAAALLHPVRFAILRELREPDSAAGVARRLGQPRQRLNHHLRALERAGLLVFVEERRVGNCVERRYRASARDYLIGPEALAPVASPDPADPRERFSWAYLVSVINRALRDLAKLRRRADRAGRRLATFTLQSEVRVASPRALADYANELTAAVARVQAKHHDDRAPRGRRYTFFAGAYPTLTHSDEEEPS